MASMDSGSSDDTSSEDIFESLTGHSSSRRSHRFALPRGEKSKKSPEHLGEDDTDQDNELGSLSWHQPSEMSASKLPSFKSEIHPDSRLSFEFDEDDQDDSDLDDEGTEPRSMFGGPYSLGNSNFCWPPPGVENVMNDGEKRMQGDKKRKPGIIFLSSIPNGFNVSRTTGFFSQFGRVGRVFLQPGKLILVKKSR